MKGGKKYEFVYDRKAYEALVEKYRDVLPPYFLPLWLDTVCGREGWQSLFIQVTSQSTAISPAAILLPHYKPILGHICQPPFTQYLGPLQVGASVSTEDFVDILKDFVGEYKPLQSVCLHTPPAFSDIHPFVDNGYMCTTRVTHILDFDLSDTDPLRPHAKEMLRRKVRRAETRDLLTLDTCSADDLIRLSSISLRRLGDRPIYTDRLHLLIQRMTSAGIGATYATRTARGEIAAAVFLVACGGCLYYVAGGHDRSLSSDAHAHCLYKSIIIEAKTRQTARIDFEGSMIPGIAYYFRSFGALPVPYFAISRGKMSWTARIKRRLYRTCQSKSFITQ